MNAATIRLHSNGLKLDKLFLRRIVDRVFLEWLTAEDSAVCGHSLCKMMEISLKRVQIISTE